MQHSSLGHFALPKVVSHRSAWLPRRWEQRDSGGSSPLNFEAGRQHPFNFLTVAGTAGFITTTTGIARVFTGWMPSHFILLTDCQLDVFYKNFIAMTLISGATRWARGISWPPEMSRGARSNVNFFCDLPAVTLFRRGLESWKRLTKRAHNNISCALQPPASNLAAYPRARRCSRILCISAFDSPASLPTRCRCLVTESMSFASREMQSPAGAWPASWSARSFSAMPAWPGQYTQITWRSRLCHSGWDMPACSLRAATGSRCRGWRQARRWQTSAARGPWRHHWGHVGQNWLPQRIRCLLLANIVGFSNDMNVNTYVRGAFNK